MPQLLYFSDLVNVPIRGSAGEFVGRLKDLVVRVGEEPYPMVVGLVTKSTGGHAFFLASEAIAELDVSGVALNTSRVDLRPFRRREREMLLNKDVMDKQIVDVSGRKVVRVNDLQLQQVGRRWRLAGADVSMAALVARLGLRRVAERRMEREVIPWENLEFFASDVPVPLHLRHEKIARMHPADIARVLEELTHAQGQELLAALDDEVVADAVEDMSPEMQTAVLSAMDHERAADILEEMEPDVAADVLGDLAPETAEHLLASMEPEEADAVKALLAYEDDTAGGLMTSEMVHLSPDATVGDALAYFRDAEELPAFRHYLYLVEEPADRLTGVVALADLVVAAPETPLAHLSPKDLIIGNVDDSVPDVARRMAHYHLFALPILDKEERLVGIITADRMLDVLVEQQARERLPGLLGGIEA
jgi:CBS domain-containing protein/sporulation protein YlmC with PRC-barrel domain